MSIQPPPVLALDIGNTRSKLGFVDVRQYTCIASTAFPTGEIAARLLPAVAELAASPPGAMSKTVALSSVVKEAGATAVKLLTTAGFSIRQLDPTGPLPLTIAYDSPRTLGADRVANALYGITLFPGRALIIISTGTAITIDYIAERIFHGGAILPGIGLQFGSLHHATDALPAIEGIERAAIPTLPGNSTEKCILGGVLHGTATAISGIVARYCKLAAPREPLILATGGDWSLISQIIDFKSIALPDLTLMGAACLLKY